MDSEEFRKRGKEMVDYIADYMDTIATRRVTPNIEPGYLRNLISSEPPQKAESWDEIMDDVEKKIMIGVTHWQHPQFHAYFPSGNSYPSILGDMLSNGLGSIGFSWAASPACTELETIVLDWMGKMVGLPEQFLAFSENSKGGGVIQGSASECVLVSLLAARAHKIRELKKQHPFVEEGVLMSKLMAYCSKEAHSCVEKAAMMAFVKLRILQPDENQSLRGPTLQQAMEEDIAMGLIPFYVETTLGTTSCCSYDNLAEIGPLCEEYGVWLHVDGAYAGNSFICPELRGPMKGIECASSFNFNPNKFMLTNFDCSVMWVRDRFRLTQALVVDPLYLQHSYSDKSIDYRHWGIPLSRRFRALKLWFVIRSFGVEGLQKYIREHCRLAKRFEAHVRKDARFEVASPVRLGLVCFRMKGQNQINARLLSSINAAGKLHMVPASLGDKYVIRFCVCAQNAVDADVDYAWQVISEFATDMEDIMQEDAIIRKTRTASESVDEMPKVSEEGDDESSEEVFQVDHKTRQSLRYKRSFFVRMVSDPKIYNPSVVRSLHSSQQQMPVPDGVQSPIFWHEETFDGNGKTPVRRVRSYIQENAKPKLMIKQNSCQNCLQLIKRPRDDQEEKTENSKYKVWSPLMKSYPDGGCFQTNDSPQNDEPSQMEDIAERKEGSPTMEHSRNGNESNSDTESEGGSQAKSFERFDSIARKEAEAQKEREAQIETEALKEKEAHKETTSSLAESDKKIESLTTSENGCASNQSSPKTKRINKLNTKELIKKFSALCSPHHKDDTKRSK